MCACAACRWRRPSPTYSAFWATVRDTSSTRASTLFTAPRQVDTMCSMYRFLRARAGTAVARLNHHNSFRPKLQICLRFNIWKHKKTRRHLCCLAKMTFNKSHLGIHNQNIFCRNSWRGQGPGPGGRCSPCPLCGAAHNYG